MLARHWHAGHAERQARACRAPHCAYSWPATGSLRHCILARHYSCPLLFVADAQGSALPDQPLCSLVRLPQRRLVLARTALAACTRAVDYAGAMLNYVVVAAAVFAGEGLHLTGGAKA